MDRNDIVRSTVQARLDLAGHLADLDPAQWLQESLCAGWTVKDVAAHVMLHPTFRWREMPGMVGRNLGRGYNAMIDRETRRRSAQRSPEDVLEEYARFATSPRHVPVTTSVEPLLDALVHTQDVVRPLGRAQEMPPAAAAVAADRARLHAALMGWGTARALRLVATDVDWARGKGPEVRGPMQELLMLLTGREPDRSLLTGEGLARV